jgi:heptosyltransferase-3
VVLTAAPAQAELAMIERILAHSRAAPLSLAGQLSLKELAALTARARLFIGVDSAPMHIAASQGTPTVALFGPSGDIEWGPWQTAHRVVTSNMHPCRPCGNDGCGGSKVSECLTTLPVAQVLEAAQALLAQA